MRQTGPDQTRVKIDVIDPQRTWANPHVVPMLDPYDITSARYITSPGTTFASTMPRDSS